MAVKVNQEKKGEKGYGRLEKCHATSVLGQGADIYT